MFATALCAGAFNGMMIDPRMHMPHPILPTKDSRSFRKIAERMVVMTTDKAPRGVTRMASVKA